MRTVILATVLVFSGVLLVEGIAPPVADAAIADSTITSAVLSKLAGFDQAYKGVEARTHDGVVTLEGTVRSDEQRAMAEAMTKQVPGVRGVNNNLTIVTRK